MSNSISPFSSRLAVGCLCAASAISVHAQSQNSVSGTGGFVSACAYSNAGSGFTPGSNLTTLFGAGHCVSDTFSGNGSANSSAAYSDPSGPTVNQAQGTVGLGTIHLSASNSAPNNSYFAAAGANGGWTETLVANATNQAGHAGVTVVALKVTGSLAAHGFAGASGFTLTGYKDKEQLSIYGVQGLYNYGSQSTPLSTDRQVANWSVSTDYYNGTGKNDASAIINDTIYFAIPVTLGTSFSFGVYGYALAGMRSASGVPGISSADTDFSHTVTWAGVVGIYDASGHALSGYSLTSASGADWTRPVAAPVPEPETWALMLTGLGLLGFAARRRKNG